MKDSGNGVSEAIQQLALIDLPASELLAHFGAGAATPGSGSAAALMSLLSASMICAVAKMTIEKSKSADAREQAAVIVSVLEGRVSPRLKQLFQADTHIFQSVIDARKRRDDPEQAADKRKNTAEASDRLKEATDTLFDIVELSFQTLENGMSIWEIGFRPAMGDAGAGISAALAAVTTCLLVANLNLRAARSNWSREAKLRCDEIQLRMIRSQERVLQLVRQSSDQTALALELPLPPSVEPAGWPRENST